MRGASELEGIPELAAEAARTVAEGDFEEMVATYRPDGRWMILVEIQRWDMTRAEWDALQ